LSDTAPQGLLEIFPVAPADAGNWRINLATFTAEEDAKYA